MPFENYRIEGKQRYAQKQSPEQKTAPLSPEARAPGEEPFRSFYLALSSEDQRRYDGLRPEARIAWYCQNR